jgi:aspartate beta-hydroxylase
MDLLEASAEARRAGRNADALALLNDALASGPAHGPTLNRLALAYVELGELSVAIDVFERAVQFDPEAVPLWLNLADAYNRDGRIDSELEALDHALALDPYILPAMLRKARSQQRIGHPAAITTWRNLLAASLSHATLPDALRSALAEGEAFLLSATASQSVQFNEHLSAVKAAFPGEDMGRAASYVDCLAGRRKVYVQEPTAGHFPYLPAIEFFDRVLFPWFSELESATDIISEELLQIWRDDEEGFRPYVAFDKTQPANQWRDLNHSSRWNAYFLWENGIAHEPHCDRCPRTASLLASLPVLDLPGKGPTAMFSVLAPKTRIPPHTGSSNVRTTIHLPLVVPAACGFRVGSQTREWKIGEAWAFDDTIEHEAWNDSDETRVILIIDAWNPLLSDAERALVRMTG